MNELIRITNNGAEIAESNYQDTIWAARGLVAVSINAGAVRFLVPDSLAEFPEAASTSEELIISDGPGQVEVMCEDHSNDPYCVFLDPRQFVDMKIPDAYLDGRRFPVILYLHGIKVAETTARYRRVKKIPCLEPMK